MRAMTALTAGALALTLAAGAGWAAQASAEHVPAHKPAQARAAVAGYQIVTLPNANVPNFQRRTVYCPSGKRAIGGGAEAQGNGAVLVGTFPTPDGAGWIALGRQDGYSSVGISVYAICASA
ncbi:MULTISPECIES: hypothetical protein [Streptomyces]|uniref:hypothetical protein n=1 Tax=Streptomyces TaxID=1883 RepID=UPI001F2AD559|nr:hypothetical protein [Streptomyces olivochromogenes]MCF3131489.1 hypothetical protein [Streptomyces olivochromogenes]